MRIGVDIGSSSTKALVLEASGRVRHSVRHRFPTRRAAGGRVEHDPERLFLATRRALLDAAASLPRHGTALLGLAAQRSTFLFWDAASGRPLVPAISWQDLRARSMVSRTARRARERGLDLRERTGLRLSAHYAAPKIAWLFREQPALRRRLASGRALWGTLPTFVVWRLTRGALYAVDHANAQRTSLFALDALAWDPALFALFDLEPLLDAPALPALVPTCLEGGAVIEAAGRTLTLAAMTGDQQAALVGMRCRREGDMAINYGSGAFVLRCSGRHYERRPGLLTTLVDSRRTRGGRGYDVTFALEGPVNAAGTAIDWLAARQRKRLRTDDLDRLLGANARGLDASPRAVHFLPAVSGVAAPHWDETARPHFTGPAKGAPLSVLLRAVIESIAQRCAEIAFAAESRTGSQGRHRRRGSKARPTQAGAVRVSGGLTRCRALLQAQADLLGRPLLVTEMRDATAVGAAALAAHGVETRARIAAEVLETVRPRLLPGEALVLRRAWARAVYGRDVVPDGTSR
jgi:glycerol kinase